MARDLLSAEEGVIETLETTDGANFTLHRVADVEPVLEANKRMQRDNPTGMGASREWQHIAEIPVIVYEKWCQDHGCDVLALENKDLLKRLLNDPDWRWLRTSEVRF